MFADEDQAAKATRDPAAPARRSAEAEEKAISKQRDDGTPVHSFQTLLEELSTTVRTTCRDPQTASPFPTLTIPNDLRLRAPELIDKICVWTETRPTKSTLGPCRQKEILLSEKWSSGLVVHGAVAQRPP